MPQPAPWMRLPWYEIRFESFYDTNGNGVGDIVGATRKLDYIADLLGSQLLEGITGRLGGLVWVTPFFQSPGYDGGYDISDYRAVDPLYGSMVDLDAFCHRAQELNLGVVVDLVLNHTSDQHPWFQGEWLGRAAIAGADREAVGEFYVWQDDQPEDWFRVIFNDSEWSNWSYERYAIRSDRLLQVAEALRWMARSDPDRAQALGQRLRSALAEFMWAAVGTEEGHDTAVNPRDLAIRMEHMARTSPEFNHRSIVLQEQLNQVLLDLGLDRVGRWYLHRFKTQQPDLNWENPRVEQEMVDVIDYWLSKPGVVGFRADAIPYAYLGEQGDGYNGENHPKTHALLARIRAHMDRHHPGKFMVCESNMPPEELFRYFGTEERPECHMVYDFTITPAIPFAFMLARATPLVAALSQERPPSLKDGRDILNLYGGVHDERTLEKVRPEIREALWRFYCKSNPWDPTAEYDPRLKLNLGYRSRTAVWLGNDRQRQALLHGIGIALEGSPLLYYGDEIGMGSLILADRDGLRLPMQWDASEGAGFTRARPFRAMIAEGAYGYRQGVNVADQRRDPESLLNAVRAMLHTRQCTPALREGAQRVLETADSSTLAFVRYTAESAVLVLGNLSEQGHTARLDLDACVFDSQPDTPYDLARYRCLRNLLGPETYGALDFRQPWEVDMGRYEVKWLIFE